MTCCKKIVQRVAPTVANDILRWTRSIFDYEIRRHILETNHTGAFEIDDTGGQEKCRERWLSREELVRFLQAMPMTKGFSRQNELTMKLQLVLCCRKMELCGARWEEFDFDEAFWRLPADRVKNADAIDIPIPAVALEWLKELHQMSCNSQWGLPARKMQHRMIPHIQESTLPVALSKVKSNLPDMPNFTIHDFRRTAQSHLAALGIDPVVT